MTPQLRRADIWILLLCTLRYAMGRQSYITAEACDLIRRYGRHLSQGQLAQIAAEIRAAVADSHRIYSSPLGSQMDEEGFIRLAEEIECGGIAGGGGR